MLFFLRRNISSFILTAFPLKESGFVVVVTSPRRDRKIGSGYIAFFRLLTAAAAALSPSSIFISMHTCVLRLPPRPGRTFHIFWAFKTRRSTFVNCIQFVDRFWNVRSGMHQPSLASSLPCVCASDNLSRSIKSSYWLHHVRDREKQNSRIINIFRLAIGSRKEGSLPMPRTR